MTLAEADAGDLHGTGVFSLDNADKMSMVSSVASLDSVTLQQRVKQIEQPDPSAPVYPRRVTSVFKVLEPGQRAELAKKFCLAHIYHKQDTTYLLPYAKVRFFIHLGDLFTRALAP